MITGVFQELNRFPGEPVRQMFAVRTVLQFGIFIGAEIGIGAALFVSAPVDFKTLVLGIMPLPAQMPFPREEGVIPGHLQRFGKGDFVSRQLLLVGRGQQRLRAGLVFVGGFRLGRAEPVRRCHARRIFARHDAGAGRAAHGTRRIGVGKAHAFPCQLINAGRLIKGAAETTQIAPAQIVHQDKHKILFGPLLPGDDRRGPPGAGRQQRACGRRRQKIASVHKASSVEQRRD